MNSKQQSKLKMYLTLRIYLLANPTITVKLPNLHEFLNSLDMAILQIQYSSEQHQFNSKGITKNKKLLRESLIAFIVDASRKMQAFSKYTHQMVLMAETKFTCTDLKDVPSLELVNIANGLYSRIDANLKGVISYGLVMESQIEYRTAIENYAESIPQTRQNQLKGKENSFLEDQGFELGNVAVDNIDTVVEIVRSSEPFFYAGYKNAHKTVVLGTSSLQIQGTVTKADSGKPIEGAMLMFRLSGQTDVVLNKLSATKGGFMIKAIPEGQYNVTITKVGFQKQLVNIVVSITEKCVLEVKMVKL